MTVDEALEIISNLVKEVGCWGAIPKEAEALSVLRAATKRTVTADDIEDVLDSIWKVTGYRGCQHHQIKDVLVKWLDSINIAVSEGEEGR